MTKGTRHVRSSALIAAGCFVLGSSGGAVAAGMVTSYQIKDNTVASVDVKDGTLRTIDLTGAARASLRGMDGPQGPAGPPGPGTVISLDFADDPDVELGSFNGLTFIGRCKTEFVEHGSYNSFRVTPQLVIRRAASSPYTQVVGVTSTDSAGQESSDTVDLDLAADTDVVLLSASASVQDGPSDQFAVLQASVLAEDLSARPITLSVIADAFGPGYDHNCRVAGTALRAP